MDLECGVSADRQTAIVCVDRQLGAAELEQLIENLMACRSEMVPRRRAVMFPGARILVGSGVHRQAAGVGRAMVAVHHPGIGWIGATAENCPPTTT
ncbi:hypothetical protein BKE38_04010 [Pseudoroseomonas deserti]|uniref:Uncharacterized protein n=1 Tax=Teichococcus deserti TaxID=1817963 RepID=A0A1V2H7A2_9PROT|nr:hypothetical protein [Pseudoroseomonas deserti]ONG57324.1 hypothetical protein BKE38_04010 [Pseudoroseomonas deserti]